MKEILKQIEVDEIILKILNALFLKENSENLKIYKEKLKTEQEAIFYLLTIDEIRKARKTQMKEEKA